ncbi:MAG: DNA repair protein RadC [Prevotellaceae bacterium]|nr:DNA repair protein RadC [Candidatus Colivivens equi]MCQ2076264.1 DNA repair protein RadC [Bacteroidaceae bacterium]
MIDNNRHSIKDWAEEDRPREKMMEKGEQALSNAELLAILIGSGTTKKSAVELMRDVMDSCGNRLSRLSQLSLEELTAFNGIGPAKAITLKAAAEMARRRTLETSDDLVSISNAEETYKIMYPIMRDLPHEEFWVLLLNNSTKLLKKVKMSSGGLSATAIDIRLVLKEALLANATHFIVCHNHPSGSLRPSSDDIHITRSLNEAAKLLKIHLIDHVIITDGKYYSFYEEGKL